MFTESFQATCFCDRNSTKETGSPAIKLSTCLSATDKNPSLVKLMGDIPKHRGFTQQLWNLIMGGIVGFMFGGGV